MTTNPNENNSPAMEPLQEDGRGFSPLAVAPPEFHGGAVSPIPEDVRVPWGWRELLLLGGVALGVAFLISIFLAVVFAAFGVHAKQLENPGREQGLYTIVSQVMLSLALLGYSAAQMRLRFKMPFWRTMGWRRLGAKRVPQVFTYLGLIAGGFLLAVLVEIASARFGENVKVPMEDLFQDRRTAVLVMLSAVLLAPIVEETIFRGYIYPVIARRFGWAAGVVATGILFGLLHAAQLWSAWVQIALMVSVGLILSYARAKKGTVVASYVLHLSYNFFISFAFLIGSDWLRVLSA